MYHLVLKTASVHCIIIDTFCLHVWKLSKFSRAFESNQKFHFSGLEADQKVLAAHQCYAMTATTALTAQNTQGVQGIHVVPSSFVENAIQCCVDDVGVDVVKTG